MFKHAGDVNITRHLNCEVFSLKKKNFLKAPASVAVRCLEALFKEREQKVTQSAFTFTHPLNLPLSLSAAPGVVFQELSAIVIKGAFTFLAFFKEVP